jgi:carbamoyltransferase
LRGEPIVCTPKDALSTFIRCQIDVLVLEDFVLERSGIPSFWEVLGQYDESAAVDPNRVVNHSVYTLL